MNICLIYKEEYPWDVRVEKIAKALARNGNRVSILARNLGQSPIIEKTEFCEIVRLLKTNCFPVLLQKIINSAFFLNPIWVFYIYKNIKSHKKSIIIVRDLPLMFSGILVAKMKGAKIIFDMAECYPEMYLSMKLYSKLSFFKKIICTQYLLDIYEIQACKWADHIFVMVEESKNRLISKGILSNKISVVSNTPPIENNNFFQVNHSGVVLRMVYVGFITRLRGLDVLIRAAHRFLEIGGASEEIKIDIIGKGNAVNELLDLVDKLDLNDVVNIHGWLEKERVEEIMSQANVGILTYRVCSHWNTTIPNKIFDYMKMGLPIIATDVITIRRIIQETKSGFICKDQDVNDVASKLLLLQDPNIRNELGNNGIKAVKDRYNWSQDVSTMNRALERL